MKKTIFVFCIFFALINVAISAELYKCVDKDGNSFLTDNPPQDVKCESNEVEDDSASQQQQSGDEVQQAGQKDENKSQKGEIKRLIQIPRGSY